MSTKRVVPFFLAMLLALPLRAQVAPKSQVTPLLTYRGFLAIDGTPVTGEVEFIFRIYKDPTQSTDKVWEEEHIGSSHAIKVDKGHFSALLGSIKPITVGKTFLENEPLYLEVQVVQVNGQVKGEVLEPRLPLTTVPASFVAQNALNIRGLDPVKFLEDKDVKVKSLTVDGGKINCSGCIDSTSVDSSGLATSLAGTGLKVVSGKLVVDNMQVPSKTELDTVKSTADSASGAASTANSDIASLLKTGTGTLDFSVNGKNTLKSILDDLNSRIPPKIACNWTGTRWVSSG